MREHKFRGKDLLTGEWREGDLAHIGKKCYIFSPEDTDSYDRYEVDTETVGEYTSVYDFWEGDIVTKGDVLYVITWHDCGFMAKRVHNVNSIESLGITHWCDSLEVIGNIFDNPELLK